MEILECVSPEWWNSLLSQHPNADLFQTTHWAIVAEEYLGHSPRYAVVRDECGLPVGALSFFIEPYFSWLTSATPPRLHALANRMFLGPQHHETSSWRTRREDSP